MKTITLDQLKEYEACVEQLHLFKELFGNEVEVTVKRCAEYYDKFSWNWAAAFLLSVELREEYSKIRRSAWEEYLNMKQLAYKGYLKIEQPALKEYEKIRRLVYKEYEKIRRSAWEKYLKIERSAYEEYLKKIAQAFGECYLKME